MNTFVPIPTVFERKDCADDNFYYFKLCVFIDTVQGGRGESYKSQGKLCVKYISVVLKLEHNPGNNYINKK